MQSGQRLRTGKMGVLPEGGPLKRHAGNGLFSPAFFQRLRARRPSLVHHFHPDQRDSQWGKGFFERLPPFMEFYVYSGRGAGSI